MMSTFQAPQVESWIEEPLFPSDPIEDSVLGFEDNRFEQQRLDGDIPEETASLEEPIPISSDRNEQAIKVGRIIYTAELPEYPETSEDGVAYLVNLQNMSPAEREVQCEACQYCRKRAIPPQDTPSTILNHTICKRFTYLCTGIHACEYLHPTLANMHHKAISEENQQAIISLRKEVLSDSKQRQANSFYLSIQLKFQQEKACLDQEASCQASFAQSKVPTISGTPLYHIRCSNYHGRPNHFFRPLPSSLHNEITFLQERFSKELEPPSDYCHIVEQTMSRRRACGIDHLQGQGKLISVACKVKFRLFKPYNLESCPYIIWTSHGIHTHAPPPPSRTPKQLVNGLIQLIQRIKDPGLTTAGLLKTPFLKEFCQQFHGETLSQVHKSFVNTDKLSLILRKQRMLQYPNGQQSAGVYHLYIQEKDSSDQYIQYIFDDSENYITICLFKRQAEILLTRESFEIDMAFKRIKERNMNEVTVAVFLPELNKVMTLARVYINQETSSIYYALFKELFQVVSKLTNKPVQWQHIHGSGFGAIVVDMDSKQLSGFGRYLSYIDPTHQPWQSHVKKTVQYCTVHFERGILQAAGTNITSSSIHQRMKQLLYCQTKDDYLKLIGLIKSSHLSSEKVINWAIHKAQPCIASGINKACSEMNNQLWDRLRSHSNAVESSHSKSYSFGIQLSLLRAIQAGRILDFQDICQYDNKMNHGINHSYRTNSLSARFAESERREVRKRKAHDNLDEEFNIGSQILDEVTSSGAPQRSRSRTSRRSQSSSSSRSSSLSRNIQPRNSASQVSLRQAATLNNQSIQQKTAELALQKEAAEIRAMEIANEKAELELIVLRRRLRDEE